MAADQQDGQAILVKHAFQLVMKKRGCLGEKAEWCSVSQYHSLLVRVRYTLAALATVATPAPCFRLARGRRKEPFEAEGDEDKSGVHESLVSGLVQPVRRPVDFPSSAAVGLCSRIWPSAMLAAM